jgi:hypothetical protein
LLDQQRKSIYLEVVVEMVPRQDYRKAMHFLVSFVFVTFFLQMGQKFF